MPTNFGTPNERIQAIAASTTIDPGVDLVLVDASAGAVTVTIPTPIGVYPNYPQGSNVGNIRIMKTDSSGNPVLISPAAGTLIGQSQIVQQYQSVQVQSDGVGSWYSFGAIQNSFEIQVAVSSADILALNATPKTLIPAQGSGKVIIVESILLKMVTTATAYANGGALEFRYTNASGAKVTADIAAAVVTAGAGTSFTSVAGVTTSLTDVANAAIVADNATAAFITGTGTAVVTIRFRVVTP